MHVLTQKCLFVHEPMVGQANHVLGSACSDMTQILGDANALKMYSLLNHPPVNISVSVWAQLVLCSLLW